MNTLPADLEALMPEPALEVGTKLLPYEERHFRSPGMAAKLGYTSNIREYFTADQMREAMLAATERAAKICDQRAADAPSIEEHYSAMECATAIRGSI